MNVPSLVGDVSPEVKKYRKQEAMLEESCKQFEGILQADLWKKMMKNAREISGDDKGHLYQPLVDTAMEMSADSLAKSGGAGMWKVLYDQLHTAIPVPPELMVKKEKS